MNRALCPVWPGGSQPGASSLPRGHLAIFGDIFVSIVTTAGGGAATGIQWAEARGDAERAEMHRPQTATASESAAPTPADAGSVRSEVRPRRGSGGETGSDAP